jgi:hypothetical protein
MKGYGLQLYTRDYPPVPAAIIPCDTVSISTEKQTMFQSHSHIPEVFLDTKMQTDGSDYTLRLSNPQSKYREIRLLEKLIVVQLFEKTPSFYVPEKFSTVFEKTRHWALLAFRSRINPIRSTYILVPED